MMTLEALFQIFSSFALFGWLLLIAAPRTRLSRWALFSGAWPLLLSASYIVLLVPSLSVETLEAFNTLDGVMSLLARPDMALAGWVHYLAFDLAVGIWITNDALRSGFPRFALFPVQLLTFLFGPVGFFLYGIIRFVRRCQPKPKGTTGGLK